MRSTCISVLALPLLTYCGYAQMMPGQPAWVTPAPVPLDSKVFQAEVVAMIYDDRGHLPVKDQEAAVAFYPEVTDVVE